MTHQKSKADAKQKPGSNGSEAIRACRDVAIAFIERGHPYSALIFVILVILLVMVIRAPEADVGKPVAAFAQLMLSYGGLLVFSISLNVVSIGAVVGVRKYYRREMRRVTKAKSDLERQLDPNRPETGLDDDGKRGKNGD